MGTLITVVICILFFSKFAIEKSLNPNIHMFVVGFLFFTFFNKICSYYFWSLFVGCVIQTTVNVQDTRINCEHGMK